jgi:ComF family protein
MLLDFICVERCRGCQEIIAQPPRDGPFCACLACWGEHADAVPLVEANLYGQIQLLVSSGTAYSGVLKKMIYRLKYDNDRAVIADLVQLSGRALETLDVASDCLLVPIPLHWMRLMARGFNQAEIICDKLGRRYGLRTDYKLLSRRRATKRQHGLGRDARKTNIEGAFRVNRWAGDKPPLVVLVDDIYTSGATLGEAATVLYKHGFTRVCAITAARATLDKL